MTDWSVAVSSRIGVSVGDVDEAAAQVLESLSDFAPALSISAEEVTVQVALGANDVREAGARGADVVGSALESAGWAVDLCEVHVTEWSLFEARLEVPTYPEMVGITEIAELLGTSRQRASELARSPRFPAPLADLAAGPVWPMPAVERFVEDWDRKPGRPRTTKV